MSLSFPLKQNPIYKVNKLIDENTIEKIVVFYGTNPEDIDLDELFKRDPKNKAFIDKNTDALIFTEKELDDISAKNIPVIFSDEQIHYDDTLLTVKLKIFTEFSKEFSLEEMYLFCLQREKINTASMYSTLTQNGRIELTKIRLHQYLLNLVYNDDGTDVSLRVPDKEIYDYDDIMGLNIDGKEFLVSKVLGQRFFIVENEYPFIVNPFEVDDYDQFIERASRKSLTTLNSNLLLNSGFFEGNTIFMCLANDVYGSMNANSISETYTTKIYYPLLAKRGILSLELLNKKKGELIDESGARITDSTLNTFHSVDLFYDMYKEKKDDLKYRKTGIKSIHITITPVYKVKIPLDVIFKLIHATDTSPLVKFNPTNRKENIYRLFADKIAKDGRKIPSLPKSSIFKLMRTIGKNKSVTVYVNYDMDGTTYSLTCEFEEGGNIGVSCEFDEIFALEKIDSLFKGAINPIIDGIKTYLEQSGYSIQLFNSIFDKNIIVDNVDYQSVIYIDKMIDLDKILGCISSVFVVETKELKNNINLRFKRVSNFNKMNSQEAFIIEQVKRRDGLKGGELVQALVLNYGITSEEAHELFAKIANEAQIEHGAKRRGIEIKVNPGFKTIISLNQISSLITVSVENIDSLNYLYLLPIYIDTLIRLTQNPESTSVPIEKIHALCSGDEQDDPVFVDIISSSEKSNMERGEIEGDKEEGDISIKESQKFMADSGDEDEQVPNALDLFFGDSDSDDEEDDTGDGISKRQMLSRPSSPSGGQPKEGNSDSSLSSFEFDEKAADQLNTSSSISTESSPEKVEVNEIEKEEEVVEKEEEVVEKEEEELENDGEELEKEEEVKPVNTVQNIDGLRLTYPNPFQSKMESLEPRIFSNIKQSGKFKAYSRSCLHNIRRQPVMLTDEDMDRIEKDIPGYKQHGMDNGEIMKYGSNPDKDYYYTCPRYWCMKTNSPISAEDVESGKCGKVIPKNAKEIKHGEYVFEFFGSEHGTKEKYVNHYPGFLDKSKHAEDLCMPCCFKSWNTQSQIDRRKQCSNQSSSKKPDITVNETNKTEIAESIIPEEKVLQKTVHTVSDKEEYIKGPEKTPLDTGRWGYLPMSIQRFLKQDASSCQISKTNTNVKQDHMCLLRHGVEPNIKRSFLACIADAKYFGEIDPVPSIDEFTNTIISSITLDSFVTFQNGDLTTNFLNNENSALVDMAEYETMDQPPKIYSKLDKSNEKDIIFFKNAVSSFNSFKKFLQDKEELVDYTYLWDIICKPNPSLFPQGINLVILEIPNIDSTDNVELLCPTNHYSSEFYDSKKKTLILLKNGDYFEPIYGYKTNKNKLNITRTISEYDTKIPKDLLNVFKKIIKPLLKNTCIPLESNPRDYKFKTPIQMHKLIEKLIKLKYKIIKQIVNYQGKVIYIIAEDERGARGVLPCYPSSIESTIDFSYMSDESYYLSYQETVDFLDDVYKISNHSIPCKPDFKVVEGEMIVGILSETNQFIQINDPVPIINVTDDIEIFDSANTFYVDSNIQTSNDVDVERVEYMRKIHLETNFYNVFRNTVRILLNRYENLKIREEIESTIKGLYSLYDTKLINVKQLLNDLIGETIIFSDDYNYNLINEISTCIVLDQDKCSQNSPMCAFTTGNTCQMILPQKNLLNGNNNQNDYFGKMADELIRYSRVNSYILNPQTYMSFSKLGYNLLDNEIVVLQSLITQEYFDGLEPAEINKYARYNTYDDADPIMSQMYENRVNENGIEIIEETDNIEVEDEPIDKKEEVITDNTEFDQAQQILCVPQYNKKIVSKVWKPCFPVDFGELSYDKSNSCGFFMLIDIIKTLKDVALTLTQLKRELIAEYKKYTGVYESRVVDILIGEGKKVLGEKVKDGKITFKEIIYSDDYFVTNFDIRIMLMKYKIPSIFVSTKSLMETNYEESVSVIYGDKSSQFVFIMCPGFRAENVPKYKLIQTSKNEITIPITIMRTDGCIASLDKAVEETMVIEDYISNYVKPKTTKYISKNPKKRQVLKLEDDDEIIEQQKSPQMSATKKKRPTTNKAKKNTSKKNIILVEE